MVIAEQRAVTDLNTFLPHKAAPEIKMLILASGSPRRKELLGGLSLNFRTVVSDIDESMTEPLAPEEYVRALAEKKARACTGSCSADDYIISADTIVCKRGVIYGKPAGREEAKSLHARGTAPRVEAAVPDEPVPAPAGRETGARRRARVSISAASADGQIPSFSRRAAIIS